MLRKFNPKCTHPERAAQAWQILIGMAMNRQTITYEGLSVLMYRKKAAGVIAQILGHIAFYCDENNLPQLNTIVVGKGRGTPGDEIPLKPADVDAIREKVYEYDWYDIDRPSAKDLAEVWAD